VLRELPVLFRGIDAGREVSDVELPEGLAALTERLAFGRSTTSERFWKPGKHDGALAREVGKSIGLTVGPWKIEERGRIADLQFGTRLSAEAGEAGHGRECDAGRKREGGAHLHGAMVADGRPLQCDA
jgi:hypothetical protein